MGQGIDRDGLESCGMGRLAYLELEDILDTVEFLLESTRILGLVIWVKLAGWCCIIRKDV